MKKESLKKSAKKICSKCGIEKSVIEFWKDKYIKDGHYPSCKSCKKEYLDQPEVKQRKKRYNQSSKMKEWNKEYRNRPEVIERRKLWEKEHRVEYNQRPEVKARRREYVRKYRKEHPELKRNGKGGVSKKLFEIIKEKHYWQCAMCGETEPFFEQYWIWLVQDHIIAKANGGKKYCKENIQPLCWDCNSLKRDNL